MPFDDLSLPQSECCEFAAVANEAPPRAALAHECPCHMTPDKAGYSGDCDGLHGRFTRLAGCRASIRCGHSRSGQTWQLPFADLGNLARLILRLCLHA